ncbi:MAG: zinc-ribbon domain-containing protein [Acidimicrobiales bacterium]
MSGILVAGDILVLPLLILLGVGLLNLIATVKIITKAGYSGWWVLVPLIPVALWFITLATLAGAANSPFNSATSAGFNASGYVALFVLDGVGALLPWVFFLVFAFSDWPVRQQLREEQRFHRVPAAVAAVPQAVSPPPQPTPHVPPPPTPSSLPAAAATAGPSDSGGRGICRRCGAPAPLDARFCGACGAAI